MIDDHQHARQIVLTAGTNLRQPALKAFRIRVEIALAVADTVLIDLRKTEELDSWTLLVLSDLAARFAPRVTFAAPDYLRDALTHLAPPPTARRNS